LRINEMYCAILGYPHEEILQRTVQDITHPDDVAAGIPPLWAVLRGESPVLTFQTPEYVTGIRRPSSDLADFSR
jgi:PAS domain-containing protein